MTQMPSQAQNICASRFVGDRYIVVVFVCRLLNRLYYYDTDAFSSSEHPASVGI